MSTPSLPLSRRDFLAMSAVGVGGGMALGVSEPTSPGVGAPSNRINVALIGHGKQGQVLFESMRNIPGLNFQAVCDIWKYNRNAAVGHVYGFQKHRPHAYEDIEEMLATEEGLDVAVIATPDFWHSPHTVKCLEAGLHVYCEKMMSNTIEGARAMIHAMEKSGKICQIGYQRRSNPRYRYTLEQLIQRHGICGQITAFNSQWNLSIMSSQGIAFNPKVAISREVLNRHGFKDMHQFMNWRHCRDLAGGPICDLASHQLDVCAWFLGGSPKSVMAVGANPYYREREVFDDVMATLQYDTADGPVQVFCQVLGTCQGVGGYFERFMGTEATVSIAERAIWTRIVPAGMSRSNIDWTELVHRGFVTPVLQERDSLTGNKELIDSRPSRPLVEFTLPGDFNKAAHQPHLENFFAAIRGEATLNCDARTAFRSEVPVYHINAAARNREPIVFTPEQLSM